MSEPQEKERYLIIFNFGSFIYMFFIIGLAAGILVAAIDAVVSIPQEPSLSSIGWALISFITVPFGLGLGYALCGAIGFLPYRWLCKKGWGWPTKGIFIKVPEPLEEEL